MTELSQSCVAQAQKSKDCSSSEVWLLMANTISNSSFELLLASYTVHCRNRNTEQACQILMNMYMVHGKEAAFWEQISKLIDAVKSDDRNEQVSFLRGVFNAFDQFLQQSLLLDFTERKTNDVEQCELYLLTLKLFPASISLYGLQLMKKLIDLQEKMCSVSTLDRRCLCPYSQILVGQVLPIILLDESENALTVRNDLLIDLLTQAIQFYVSFFASGFSKKQVEVFSQLELERSDEVKDRYSKNITADVEKCFSQPWHNLLQLFQACARKLGWKISAQLDSFTLESVEKLLDLVTAIKSVKENQQIEIDILIVVLTVYTIYGALNSLIPKLNALSDGSKTRRDLKPIDILLFIPEISLKIPNDHENKKRRKTQDDKNISFYSELSNSPSHEGLIPVLLRCYGILVRLFENIDFYEKIVLSNCRNSKSHYERLNISSIINSEHVEKCESFLAKSTEVSEVEILLLRSTCSLLSIKDRKCDKSKFLKKIVTNILAAVKGMQISEVAKKVTFSESAHFGVVSSDYYFDYCIRILIYCLRNCRNSDLLDPKITKYDVILMQFDWPRNIYAMEELMNEVVSSKMDTDFYCILPYIVLPDVLEEIAFVTNRLDSVEDGARKILADWQAKGNINETLTRFLVENELDILELFS